MLYKFLVFITGVVFVSACSSDVAAFGSNKADAQTSTTVTDTTDEIGNKVLNVKSRRDEGYVVHPSNQITKITDAFYCEGYNVETLIVKRQENDETRSADLTLKVNGEVIDLRPIIGSKSNLIGYSNLRTSFVCVDRFVRIIVEGQEYTQDSELSPTEHVVDMLVDITSGNITSKVIAGSTD